MTDSGLYVDPTIPRFTRRDLLTAADASGHPITEAALRDWQSKGFIGDPVHADRWKKGAGGSRKALWSDNQRQLLLCLLQFRDRPDRTGQDISGLGNVVIWMWAFYDGIVDDAQARRALTTWTRSQVGGVVGSARTPERMRRLARRALAPLVAPGVPRRELIRVSNKLTDLYWRDDQAGLAAFIHDIRPLMDPDSVGRLIGPSIRPVGPELAAKAFTAPLRAAHSLLSNAKDITARDWEFTRWYMKKAWAGYSAEWPILTATNDGALDLRVPDVGAQVAAAASSALRILGVELLDRDETRPSSSRESPPRER